MSLIKEIEEIITIMLRAAGPSKVLTPEELYGLLVLYDIAPLTIDRLPLSYGVLGRLREESVILVEKKEPKACKDIFQSIVERAVIAAGEDKHLAYGVVNDLVESHGRLIRHEFYKRVRARGITIE